MTPEMLAEIRGILNDDQPSDGWLIHANSLGLLRALLAEVERLQAENAAFREAIRTGEGPMCEDVCLVECLGPCGAGGSETP